MFELCSGIGTNSRKTRNRPKKAKAHRNAEGGAAFLPRPLLPPRPHPCWRFWGFRTRRRRVPEAKRRGRGRGGVGFSPACYFHRKRRSQSSQWLEAAHFRFHGGLWRARSVCPYGSRTFHRRFVATVGCSAVPTSAGRGQKSVRRSGSRPLLDKILFVHCLYTKIFLDFTRKW